MCTLSSIDKLDSSWEGANGKALVIGAGFGGLAAAMRLLSKGYKVQVFEKNLELGGRGSSINRSCLLYTSPSPRDVEESRMPSSA